MRTRFGPSNWNRVVIDVCTQRDFLDAGAIVQVANRAPLLANLRDLFRWIKSNRVPVVSMVESHRPEELVNGFPLHCIDGDEGQEKLSFSLLKPRVAIEADNYLSLPPNLLEGYRQLLFRKRTREVLGNPKADRFLTQLAAEEFIIVGVGLERSIKSLALSLRARHKPLVTVVSDACGYWSVGDAELARRKLAAKNIRLISTVDLIVPPPTLPAPRPAPARRSVRRSHHPARPLRKRGSRPDAARR